MWQWRICTFWHVGRCFSSVNTKRRQALLHYLIIKPTRDSSSLFISLSLCLLPSLHRSTHILSPPIPLVAAKALTDKLQGRQRKRDGKRERERGRERQWYTKKKKKIILAPEYIVFALCHVSYFRFLYPPPPPPPPLPRCSLRLPCFLVCGAPGRSKFNSLMCD